MRSSKKRSRSNQNRPRTLGNIVNRVFDSSGPEGKVRGTPQQIIEKYQALARDAQLSNDRVAAENFLQHAEHYTRMLAEAQRELAAEQEARQQHYQQNGNSQGNGPAQNGNREFRERNDRNERGERGERQDRGERYERGDRHDRGQGAPAAASQSPDVIDFEGEESALVDLAGGNDQIQPDVGPEAFVPAEPVALREPAAGQASPGAEPSEADEGRGPRRSAAHRNTDRPARAPRAPRTERAEAEAAESGGEEAGRARRAPRPRKPRPEGKPESPAAAE